MYRVLIVDDEPEIRLGLRLKVDWDDLGLTVAGEASNGVEALERLADEPFDIVIADMNMPVMNGVSLLEACHERYPYIRLLVITGYEDFQYARAAIRHQARDYLLKPVSREEMTAALRKIAQQLDEERKEQNEQKTVQWRLSQYYKEMKEHFIVHLVKEPLEPERIVRDRAKLFELEAWDARSVRFLTAGLRERSERARAGAGTIGQLRLPFELICREFAASYPGQPPTFRDANYPGLMHFILFDDESAVSAFAAALRDCITGQLKNEPAIGIGQPVAGFRAWQEGYLSSLLAWSLEEGNIRLEPQEPSGGSALMTEDTAKLLRRFVAKGELEAFGQTVRKELTRAFCKSQGHFVKLIFQLYLLLDSMAHAAGAQLDNGNQLWLRPDMVLGLDTVDKAADFLVRLGSRLHRGTAGGSDEADRSVIEAALQFIRDNYMVDLNLTMLAERFNYNPSYFSELFKSKVGKTFIQVLTEVRMAQAVRLLEETTLNLWDIAELTGFSNPSYFSAKFKRMYGMTPSEFRQQASKKIDIELPKK
jgi:two-component system response regulator YesN